ncbi:MAG TPA: ATP-binding protein [Deltaproteobacteria bacterium]|nr:ATP-binding protein [Deltaproteobacteria bacterium]HXK46498.1 ATP-binding protein [Deltaproteobacteria bacterium]
MDIRKEQVSSYGKWFLTDVIRAIENYSLIKNGEGICVALSGGRDSVTLLYILWYLQHYSHLAFGLRALHVKTDDYDTAVLKRLCEDLEVEYLEARLNVDLRSYPKSRCSLCAAFKRGAMAEALNGTGITRVAFGHHADDAAETLLMNIVHNRKLGSFTPRVEVPEGGLVIVRPLIYLDGPLVRRLHNHFRLPVLRYECPYADKGAREVMRMTIARIEEQHDLKGFSRMVVSALENVDDSTLWADLRS